MISRRFVVLSVLLSLVPPFAVFSFAQGTTAEKASAGAMAVTGQPAASHLASAAQTPQASVTSSVQVSIGAQALGLGATSDATPASEIITDIQFTKSVTLESRVLEDPGADLQYYGGGFKLLLPASLLSKTALSSLAPYVDVSVGADRIVPATGPSQSHIAFQMGGGLNWCKGNLCTQLVEINYGRLPGLPSGASTVLVGGGLSWAFTK